MFLTDIWFRGLLPVAPTAQAATTGDGFKNITAGVGSIVTALAVVIGGVWAYFKFVKGRTYHPRFAVRMLAQWRLVDGRYLLHTRTIVTNIGASFLSLRLRGSGLRISLLSVQQEEPPSNAHWDVIRVFEILKESEQGWIEAGESRSDDLLLDIGVAEPVISLLEARLVWSWSGRHGNTVVWARQVVPPDSTMDGPTDVQLGPVQGEPFKNDPGQAGRRESPADAANLPATTGAEE